MLQGDRLEAFAATVATYGLKTPIVLFENKVLDGRNRLYACDVKNVQPRTEVFTGSFEQAARFARGMNNDARRHSTEPERAIAAARLAKLLQEESERRMRAGTPAPDGARVGKSAEIAADIVGTSARQTERVMKVLDQGTPELQRAMLDQTITISDAAHLAGQSAKVQDRAINKVREGKTKTLSKAVRQDEGSGTAAANGETQTTGFTNAPKIFAKGREMIQKLEVYMDICNKARRNQAKRNRISELLTEVFHIFEDWSAAAMKSGGEEAHRAARS
jgi:hypothetical protein